MSDRRCGRAILNRFVRELVTYRQRRDVVVNAWREPLHYRLPAADGGQHVWHRCGADR